MPDIKLPRLPERTPIKLTVGLSPELHQALTDYASLYAETYGKEEPLAELVPAILGAFLDNDREFARRRRAAGAAA